LGGAAVVCAVHDGRAFDFFRPAKYGLLPQVLDAGELVGGNAILETGTFLAILLGTLAAGLLAGHSNATWIEASLVIVAIAGS